MKNKLTKLNTYQIKELPKLKTPSSSSLLLALNSQAQEISTLSTHPTLEVSTNLYTTHLNH